MYFRRVFEALDGIPSDRDFTFYLTNNIKQLPSYGRDVVAIVVGDEHCRIPSYLHKVGGVFKNCGTHPRLGCRPMREPSIINVLSLLVFGYRCLKYIPGLTYYLVRLISGRRREFAPFCEIPLGTANQEIVPFRELDVRSTGLFFAGSVAHGAYTAVPCQRNQGPPQSKARCTCRDAQKCRNDFKPPAQARCENGCRVRLRQGDRQRRACIRRPVDGRKDLACTAGGLPADISFFSGDESRLRSHHRRGSVPTFFAGAPAIHLKSWDDLGGDRGFALG